MVGDHIRKTLNEKSKKHQHDLQALGKIVEDAPLSPNVTVLDQTSQVVGLNSVILDPETGREDFIFTFDRIASLLIDRYVSFRHRGKRVADSISQSNVERKVREEDRDNTKRRDLYRLGKRLDKCYRCPERGEHTRTSVTPGRA